MRVAFLTQWYPQDDAGFIHGIAQALTARGAQVAVFTGSSSYATRKPADVGERVGILGRRSFGQDVPVIRYPFFNTHDRSSLRRFATYGTFAASSLTAIPQLRESDVVLAYCSPATAATAAMLARRTGGPPYVLMIQDVWPDSIFATGFLEAGPSRLLAERTVNAYMNAAYSGASQVTALSPGMRELLITRGADPNRTHVIYNWTDEEAAARVQPPLRQPGEPLHLMYAGNVGPGQDLNNVVRALALIPQDSIRFTVVGGGAALEDVRREAEALGLGNVAFRDRVPLSEMPEVLSTAHLHLVSLADTELFRITLPSKTQSLLAAGLPVLAVAPGEVGQIVTGAGAGFSAAPGDPAELAVTLRAAVTSAPEDLAAMGANGKALYADQMSEAINAERLYEVLKRAAG